MGGAALLPPGVPCAKGPVPYSLDQCSRGRGARARLEGLQRAITGLAPDYQRLVDVFDAHLLRRTFNASPRQQIVAHLRAHWFDPSSPEAYFPNQKVAEIYAQGVLKAVELSLKGRRRRVVPINTWWIVDFDEENGPVKMLTLADVEDEVTVGGEVTLLILTPRPQGDGETGGTFILGDEAEAWVSEQQGENVVTLRVRDLR